MAWPEKFEKMNERLWSAELSVTSKIADVFLMLYGRLKTRVKHTDNAKNYWRVGFLLKRQ